MRRIGGTSSWRLTLRLLGMLMPALLVGCAKVPDPGAGLSVEQTVALIDRAPRSEGKIADLAEAFAFGTKATQAQRDQLTRDVVGHAVEWQIPVSDVGYAEGRFEVTSQAIPTADRAKAVPMLRVIAFVTPRNEADQVRLMKLKSDDLVGVRGIVQEIRGGRMVAILPAVLAVADH